MNDFGKRVELIGVSDHLENHSWNPGDYLVTGALGCFSEENSSEIHKTYAELENLYGKKYNWEQTTEKIMKETVGRGHSAVLDQLPFIFSLSNISRASTLFLCSPEYASHLQQSLRRANAEKGFVNINDSEGNALIRKQFKLYYKMKNTEIPTEDARIILPLGTKTAIQTLWNARELLHLESMASRMRIPEEVRDTVKQMYEEARKVAPEAMYYGKENYEILSCYPSPQLFAPRNSTLECIANERKGLQLTGFSKGLDMTEKEIQEAIEGRDEALLANLKHYHFSFNAPMSLMTLHQAFRQRTWNQSVEPLNNAIKRCAYITPDSIANTKFKKPYKNLVEESIYYAHDNINNPNSQMVVPHAIEVYDAIHINGWNAIHSIGKRTCETAQWEIREIAREMGEKIKEKIPELGKYCQPQGIIYSTCPEKEKCGKCFQK